MCAADAAGGGCGSTDTSCAVGGRPAGDSQGGDRVLNADLLHFKQEYLFKRTGEAVAAYCAGNPGVQLIDLGIGDVSMPLAPCAAASAAEAAVGMTTRSGFRGYGPYEGYRALRAALAEDYRARGVRVSPDEIFVTNGAKGGLFLLLSLFSRGVCAAIPNPVYPAYRDANAVAGNRVSYIEGSEDNGFLPLPHDLGGTPQLIYLCSPNNPTGAVYDRRGLSEWVAHARRCGAVIIFDAAYRDYISGDAPASIFEVEGADECAVEIGSFSKSAAFTGVRCGWTVIPERLERDGAGLRGMYGRLAAVADNGVSYLVQRAACGALSLKSQRYNRRCVGVYKKSAAVLSDALASAGLAARGGVNSPYVWARCPRGMTSEETFGFLLNSAQVVCTPGDGFGSAGEGYIRLSSFCACETAELAAKRIEKALKTL